MRLFYFRTNLFHMTEGGCALVLQKDLEYWTIGGYVGSIVGYFVGVFGNFWVFVGSGA